jgi:hypothetical protein
MGGLRSLYATFFAPAPDKTLLVQLHRCIMGLSAFHNYGNPLLNRVCIRELPSGCHDQAEYQW